MDDSFKILLKSQGGAIVRAALYLMSGILLRKGYINHNMDATQANQLVGVIIGGCSLAWAMIATRRKHRETEVALSLPDSATRDDLNRRLANK